MRDLLDHADLARYAGQFVWLELNYDDPANRSFMDRFGAQATPLFFVIDPRDEQVTATQPGAMSLEELKQFLERGADGVRAKGQIPAEAALTRGDTLRARAPADAAKAYQEALRLAPANWLRRDLAEASLVGALQDSGQWQECADGAASVAEAMKRSELFPRVVVAGMWCVVSADSAPWVEPAAKKLEVLAAEALSLKITVRDHRDELYRTLMNLAVTRKDNAAAGKWGDLWLAELDAITPSSDDERAALDIARVENVQTYGDPERILPALRASERAMPNNYISSLRLAQAEKDAKHNEAAYEACTRGLARQPGANGRAWLLRIKAQLLVGRGETAEAQRFLQEALEAAHSIPDEMGREMNVKMIEKELKAAETKPK